MITVKDLIVKVSYNVGLRDVEIPQEVYDQINEAVEMGDEFDISGMLKYPEASQWLFNNIHEGDCMDWSAEVDLIS